MNQRVAKLASARSNVMIFSRNKVISIKPSANDIFAKLLMILGRGYFELERNQKRNTKASRRHSRGNEIVSATSTNFTRNAKEIFSTIAETLQ